VTVELHVLLWCQHCNILVTCLSVTVELHVLLWCQHCNILVTCVAAEHVL